MQPAVPSLTSRILRVRRVRQALALLLLVGIAVSAAFLLTPSRFTPAIPGDEAMRFLRSQRDEFWKALQAVVEDDDYVDLARSGFDPAVERAALRVAGLAASAFVVEERGLLAADRERGIMVRTLGGVGAPEQAVRDIDRIQDLLSARQNVERIGAAQLGDLPPRTARAVTQLVRRALKPNLAYDDAETRRRQEGKRAQVKDVLLQVRKGEKIIGDGEQITKTHLLIFQALRAAGKAGDGDQLRWGGGLFAALLC